MIRKKRLHDWRDKYYRWGPNTPRPYRNSSRISWETNEPISRSQILVYMKWLNRPPRLAQTLWKDCLVSCVLYLPGPFPFVGSVRSDQSVLKWNARVLRTRFGQNGPAESCCGENVRAHLRPFLLNLPEPVLFGWPEQMESNQVQEQHL